MTVTYAPGEGGAPPEATTQAFGDWLYGTFYEGTPLPGEDVAVAMVNAWWANRWQAEADYGPVDWQPPHVVLEVADGSGPMWKRITFNLRFPAKTEQVNITLTSTQSDTVDGTATEEEEET